VILVTTKDQETDRMWGMRQGAKAYLTKPFSEDELAAAITRNLVVGPDPAAA
jgi:twitching motility two-component system response regulator PilH